MAEDGDTEGCDVDGASWGGDVETLSGRRLRQVARWQLPLNKVRLCSATAETLFLPIFKKFSTFTNYWNFTFLEDVCIAAMVSSLAVISTTWLMKV